MEGQGWGPGFGPHILLNHHSGSLAHLEDVQVSLGFRYSRSCQCPPPTSTGPTRRQKKDTVLAVSLPSSVNSLLGHRLPQIHIQVFLAFGP